MHVVELYPAYGRKYKSVSLALADWKAGKDFKVIEGFMRERYCSIRDFPDSKPVFKLK